MTTKWKGLACTGLAAFTSGLVGCGAGTVLPGSTARSTMTISGTVHGGQQPVTGATIQLWQAGTTGDGSAATPMLTTTVTTADGTGSLPAGNFSITGDYTCPGNDPQVYITAVGGNPGLGTGQSNPQLALMAILGKCSTLTPSTFINLNEETTIGSLIPLTSYMTVPGSYGALGSGTSDASQLASAIATVAEYTNVGAGTVPGPSLPSGYYGSSLEIASLANAIATCVNSSGGSAGDGSSCGKLFSDATVGGVIPTDTVGALVSILQNPTNNACQIFNLASSAPPFQPSDPICPSTWSMPIEPIAATPVISPGSGTLSASTPIYITDGTSGSTVIYTTDGSTPSMSNGNTCAPSSTILCFTLSSPATVRAIAVGSGLQSSGWVSTGVASASYTFSSAPPTSTQLNGAPLSCMVGDGMTDNASCLSNALATCAEYCNIQFGAGNYLFLSAISYTLADDEERTLSVSGQGVGQTTLTFNGSDGFSVVYSGVQNDAVHFSTLTLSQTGQSVGTAVALNGCASGVGVDQFDPTTFDNVKVTGTQITSGEGWLTGVSVCTVSEMNFNGFDFEAPASVGTGISFMGQQVTTNGTTKTNYSIQEQIIDSFFRGGATGIFYGNWIQGVAVVNSTFSGMTNAVVVNAVGGSQLSLFDDVIGTLGDGIVFDSDFPIFFFSNNVQTVPANHNGIAMSGKISGTIDDNDFVGPGQGHGAIAVNGLSPARQVTIAGNSISGFDTGISFAAGTSAYTAYNNTETGNGTNISDSGTNASAAPDSETLPQCETIGMVCQNNKLVPSSQVQTYSGTLPPTVVLPSNVFLANQFGCVAGNSSSNGTANNTCMATMLQACPVACTIDFGAGVYVFGSAVAFTFADDTARSLSIVGQGQGTTQLSFAGTDGLDVNYSSRVPDAFTLYGLTVVQQQVNAGTGVHLKQAGLLTGASALLQNVTLLPGTATKGGWVTGVWDDGVSNATYLGVMVDGRASQTGTGILLDGTVVPVSTVEVINCIFISGGVDLQYGNNVSNVTVINNEFTNSATGLSVTGQNASGLDIKNTQYGNTHIYISAPLTGFQFDNDLVIVGTPSAPDSTGMTLTAPVSGRMVANNFGGQGDGTGAIGITANASTAGSSLTIDDNRIGGFNTGVNLGTGSSGFNVYDNFYFAAGKVVSGSPSDGTNVVNAGTGNVVSQDP